MIKAAPHSTLSPQMWCIKKKNKRLVCTHPDLLARICKLVDRKKLGLICFPRLIYRGGSRGRVQGVRTPLPSPMTYGFLINTVQSLHSHTKSAVSFDMYSQQFTLCYFLVKSHLLRIRF